MAVRGVKEDNQRIAPKQRPASRGFGQGACGGRLHRSAAVAKPSRSSFAMSSRWNKFCRVAGFPRAAAGRGRHSRAPSSVDDNWDLAVMVMANAWRAENCILPPLESAKRIDRKISAQSKG